MQNCDAVRGQSRLTGDEYVFSAGDWHWKRAANKRLLVDEQESTVTLAFGDEGTQLGLVVE